MVGRDITGPLGNGSLTGRGLGPCGRGFARRRAFGWQRFPISETLNLSKEDQKKILEQEAKAIEEEQKILKQELDNIKKRIAELEK